MNAEVRMCEYKTNFTAVSMTRPVQRAAQQIKRWFARNEALLVKLGFARSGLGM